VLKQIFLYTALFWTGFILYFCLIKSSDLPQVNIQNIDKLVHAFLHFVFTLLWFFYFKKKIGGLNNLKLLITSLVFSLFFGIAIELMQKFFTVSRNADIFDVFANLFGATMAVIFIITVNKYKGIIDKI